MKYEKLDKMLGLAMKCAIWCIMIMCFALVLTGI